VWDKGYRYGFNGMEKDNEISGNGNSYTTEFRQLDVRLGRWFSRDPIERAFESDYAGFSNNPIIKVDPDGDSDFYTANGEYLGSDGTDGADIHIVTNQDVIDKLNEKISELEIELLEKAKRIAELEQILLQQGEEREAVINMLREMNKLVKNN
jgi:RHS repeat-associated protein